jgi:hypothetical protein
MSSTLRVTTLVLVRKIEVQIAFSKQTGRKIGRHDCDGSKCLSAVADLGPNSWRSKLILVNKNARYVSSWAGGEGGGAMAHFAPTKVCQCLSANVVEAAKT